ncbi:MAG: hypothetical protein ACLTDF_07050 [Coprococcus sp.]
MAFALSAMMLTSVNMPEVTAWAGISKVTYYSTWSAAKILWLRNNEPHGTDI